MHQTIFLCVDMKCVLTTCVVFEGEASESLSTDSRGYVVCGSHQGRPTRHRASTT